MIPKILQTLSSFLGVWISLNRHPLGASHLIFQDRISLGPGAEIQCVGKPQKWIAQCRNHKACVSMLGSLCGWGLNSGHCAFVASTYWLSYLPSLFLFIYYYYFWDAGLRFHNPPSSASWTGICYQYMKKASFLKVVLGMSFMTVNMISKSLPLSYTSNPLRRRLY